MIQYLFNSKLNMEMYSSIYMNKYEYQNQYLFSFINSRAFETHRLIFSRGVTLFLFDFIIKNKDNENLYIYKIKNKVIFTL
jgi:hypothetical protein